MTADSDIAVPMTEVPGYAAWSRRKLAEGEDEELLACLEKMTMWRQPGDTDPVAEAVFEDLLADLEFSVEQDEALPAEMSHRS
jgi:hypothetical protein